MTNISERLTALAEAAGKSLNALAHEAGMAEATLRRRIRRPADLTMGEVLALSEALGVTPDSLFPSAPRDVAAPGVTS